MADTLGVPQKHLDMADFFVGRVATVLADPSV